MSCTTPTTQPSSRTSRLPCSTGFANTMPRSRFVRGDHLGERDAVAERAHAPVHREIGAEAVAVERLRRLARSARDVAQLVGLDQGTGLSPGSGTKDHFVWVDDNQDGLVETTSLRDIPGAPGEPSQTFHRNGLGADSRGALVRVRARRRRRVRRGDRREQPRSRHRFANPVEQGKRDVRELGWVVGVVQDITPNARVGVRYDRYDGDRDAARQAGIDQVSTDSATRRSR